MRNQVFLSGTMALYFVVLLCATKLDYNALNLAMSKALA